MKYQVHYQTPHDYLNMPNIFIVQRWINTTLEPLIDSAEVTIRVTDESEVQQLNFQYRKKNKPTNVLSFPSEVPALVMQALGKNVLGDIIICHPVIEAEAKEQHKSMEAHYAHMIIHGLLHLLGYDHIKEEDALIMEPLEIDALAKLGFNNPYEQHNDTTNT